jgi:hypothetical protein
MCRSNELTHCEIHPGSLEGETLEHDPKVITTAQTMINEEFPRKRN